MEVTVMRDKAIESCRQRATRLEGTLQLAERFHGDVNEITGEMNRIKDLAIRSHEIPIISTEVVRQQLADLKVYVLIVTLK